MYIFGPDTAGFPFVGGSGSGTSAEQVDLANPAPGFYFAVVHGWQTDGPDSNYVLFNWNVGSAGSSLSIDSAPTSATVGGSGTVAVSWSGLATGTKYIGAVEHSSGAGVIGLTLVSVET